MKEALLILRASLQDLWGDIWTTALCNLLWLLSIVTIIPAAPATVALFYYGNRLAHGEAADLGDFLGALRRYWGAGWRWGFINLLVISILVGDTILTGRLSQSNFARFSQGFYLAALAGWLLVQLYALPFLFEQEKPSVGQALRNGAVMLGRNVSFSLALGLLLGVTLLAGLALFMLSAAAGGVLLAAAGNRAVLNRLEVHSVVKEVTK